MSTCIRWCPAARACTRWSWGRWRRNPKVLSSEVTIVSTEIEDPVRISKNMIGVAGEYYVCAELCRRNILALVAPKNNPLFDVIASDPSGRRSVAIQVKTMAIENEGG